MRYRLLGQTGLRVSEIILGAMTFGEQGGVGAPLTECRRILDAYAEAGGNVIDTAINYRGGSSEEFLGELLVGRRDRFVLGSKYSVTRDPADPNAAGNHRKNLRLSLETSLRRLKTDYLDIYWVHMWDRFTPIEETISGLDEAVRSGKVLYLGISDTPAWVVAKANTLADWRGLSRFAALQVPYSLLQRDIERDLLPMAEVLGMTVAAWAPLGGGLLSGKYVRADPNGERGRLDPASVSGSDLEIARAVAEAASDLNATPAQVAIRWVMQRSAALHPIIGARSLDQLLDNLGAADLALSNEMMQRLDAAAPFNPGFPTTFIAANSSWVLGAAADVG